MPLAKTQKASSLTTQHGPSVARDALLKAYASIATGFVSSLRVLLKSHHIVRLVGAFQLDKLFRCQLNVHGFHQIVQLFSS